MYLRKAVLSGVRHFRENPYGIAVRFNGSDAGGGNIIGGKLIFMIPGRSPNYRAGVDAGLADLLELQHLWPGTTQHGRRWHRDRAKRMECVQLAGAFGVLLGVRQRQQAARTPDAGARFMRAVRGFGRSGLGAGSVSDRDDEPGCKQRRVRGLVCVGTLLFRHA